MSFEFQPIVFIVGIFTTAVAALMGVPAVADVMTGNPDWLAFATSGFVGLFCGGLLILSSYRDRMALSVRQAFLLTTGATHETIEVLI